MWNLNYLMYFLRNFIEFQISLIYCMTRRGQQPWTVGINLTSCWHFLSLSMILFLSSSSRFYTSYAYRTRSQSSRVSMIKLRVRRMEFSTQLANWDFWGYLKNCPIFDFLHDLRSNSYISQFFIQFDFACLTRKTKSKCWKRTIPFKPKKVYLSFTFSIIRMSLRFQEMYSWSL